MNNPSGIRCRIFLTEYLLRFRHVLFFFFLMMQVVHLMIRYAVMRLDDYAQMMMYFVL